MCHRSWVSSYTFLASTAWTWWPHQWLPPSSLLDRLGTNILFSLSCVWRGHRSHTICVVLSESTERERKVMHITTVPCRRGMRFNSSLPCTAASAC